ncbi:MAG: glycoside hydrolase family 3 N-terminal domain-containing protein [Candidatus Zixiibacteriota bacterium]
MTRDPETPNRSVHSPLVLSYDGLEPDDELMDWVSTGLASGVVIFKENATDETRLAAAIARIRGVASGRFHVMIDEEGGRVRRLPDAPASMPFLRTMESESPDAVAGAYRRVAERLLPLGIDTLLAPVADVGDPAGAWLRDRTYSDDPRRTAAMLHAVIPAIQKTGIHACAKHFPGMRAVTIDPHTDVATDPTRPSAWEAIDAIPFRTAILAGVHMIMVSHQIMMGFDATRPACLSPLIIRVLLRERLGFAGLVLTDDLAMGAISKKYPIDQAVRAAVEAGADLVLVCRNRELQRRAVAWQCERQNLQTEARV